MLLFLINYHSHLTKEKWLNITKDYGILVSPNYPNDYPKHKQLIIVWYINVPKGSKMNLEFWAFDVGKNSSENMPSYDTVCTY